jgi:hypothetical protein
MRALFPAVGTPGRRAFSPMITHWIESVRPPSIRSPSMPSRKPRRIAVVPLDHPLVLAARSVGTLFGDEASGDPPTSGG